MCDLGKPSEHLEFKEKLVEFFMKIIMNGENYNDEIATSAIGQFCEMVKFSAVDFKFKLFDRIVDRISE